MATFKETVGTSSSLLNATMNWGTNNNNGNLLGSTFVHTGGAGLSGSLTFGQTFIYDGVNRLNTITETGNFSRSFAYDPYGNMFVSYASASMPTAGNTPTSYVYNSNNQISSSTYDDAGNQVAVNGNSITYDAENHQTNVVGAGVNETYVYDGDGRRVGKYANTGTPTSVFVYDASGRMAAEYSTYVDGPNCITCYLSADHIGTPRLTTDQSGNVIGRHDYLPFGEEIQANAAGRNAQWGSGNDSINQKFTGKERDSESGLDYFGARYYGSALGRFTSPDPLMASAHASNPQSWNRYAYTLNNPLRFVDPDGMDVPAACAQDKSCQIVVKINVVYDNTVHDGKGLTDKEKSAFEKNQLQRAQKDFGNSNIKLDFTYTQGSYTSNDNISGLKSDSLNLVVSNATPTGESGVSGLAGKNGTAVSFLNFNEVDNANAGPLFSNTTEHEMGHQFLGDPSAGRPNGLEHFFRDTNIDSRNTAQGLGMSQSAYREGLEPRRYAVPASPEANKPQK